MTQTTDQHGAERGETLVEVLVTVVIMGVAAVGILAGLGLSLKSSAIVRNEATSGAYVRSYAEAVEGYLSSSSHYKACAPANYYTPTLVGFTLPNGYTAKQTAAVLWGGSSWGTCSTSKDVGVQQVTLTIASTASAANDGASEILTVVLRKACVESPTSAAC